MATEPQLQPFPQVFQVTRLLVGSGTAAAPGISFIADPDTGIYNVPDNVAFSVNGVSRMVLNTAHLYMDIANGPALERIASSHTVPTVCPTQSVTATGIGADPTGVDISLIVSSAEVVRVDASVTAGQTRFLIYDVDNATLERVTVGVADSGGAGFKLLRIPN